MAGLKDGTAVRIARMAGVVILGLTALVLVTIYVLIPASIAVIGVLTHG
jgi:hypothetical protein